MLGLDYFTDDFHQTFKEYIIPKFQKLGKRGPFLIHFLRLLYY